VCAGMNVALVRVACKLVGWLVGWLVVVALSHPKQQVHRCTRSSFGICVHSIMHGSVSTFDCNNSDPTRSPP
jgi:hypothetical protein